MRKAVLNKIKEGILLLIVFVINPLLTACKVEKDTVYICTGPTAYAYHYEEDCHYMIN